MYCIENGGTGPTLPSILQITDFVHLFENLILSLFHYTVVFFTKRLQNYSITFSSDFESVSEKVENDKAGQFCILAW